MLSVYVHMERISYHSLWSSTFLARQQDNITPAIWNKIIVSRNFAWALEFLTPDLKEHNHGEAAGDGGDASLDQE